MQKFKVTASKNQKKYTLVLSAESETEAREKAHKEWYSILGVSEVTDTEIKGQKFIFQVEQDGDIRNGVIVGKDLFKVYMKLKDDLGYHLICLYPEWDEAHTNSEKKQAIMQELEQWYELQKKKELIMKNSEKSDENFYLKKKLDHVYGLIARAIKKFDVLFNERQKFKIDDETFSKLQAVYEKLIHIKNSTNLSKLQEIWELALVKIAEIELRSIEEWKNNESRELLKQTNDLLKKIGSDRQFIEKDKDIKRMISSTISQIQKALSFKEIKNLYFEKKQKKKLLDTESYSFLKTVLLLEKYKEKLSQNSKEIRENMFHMLNPFARSANKEKLYLKRKVIKQNISILKAKKTWSLGSYTSIKKWYHKIIDGILSLTISIKDLSFIGVCLYCGIFFVSIVFESQWYGFIQINPQGLSAFLLFCSLFFLLSLSKNIFLLTINIVFFFFIFIFSKVNF